MFKIFARYRGVREEIDSTETEAEAIYLVGEYQLSYGREWLVWFQQEA